MNYKKFKKEFDYHDPPYAFFYKYVKRSWLYPLTYRICKLPYNPNLYSYLGYLMAILTAVFFSTGNHFFLILGIIGFFAYEACDDFDGISARFKGISNRRGGWLDILAGTIGKTIILLGVTIGVYNSTNNPSYLILGLVAITGFAAVNNIDHVTKIRFSKVTQKKLKYEEVKPDFKSFSGKLSIISEVLLNTWAVLLIITALFNVMGFFLYFSAIYYTVYPIANFFRINYQHRDE